MESLASHLLAVAPYLNQIAPWIELTEKLSQNICKQNKELKLAFRTISASSYTLTLAWRLDQQGIS